jgi:8-oxo-dGTP pyrophosphatase MutT (NUDIX family)
MDANSAQRLAISRLTAGFDPQSLPLMAAPAATPALRPEQLQTAFLRQRFAQADALHTPLELAERPWLDKPLTPSAVLLPLVQRDTLQVLLTQRAASLSNHSGQIAFAGGRIDPTDANAVACALREAREEIGLDASHIEVLGTLPPYTTGTAFEITPVVALVRPGFALSLNPAEVESAFEIALPHLMNPRAHFQQQADAGGVQRHWWAMPSTDENGQNRFVWGASAGILRSLYQFLRAQNP